MRVCYFGIYNPLYSRNRILIRGLRQNGVFVIECNSRSAGVKKYWELIQKHRKIRNNYSVMIVGYPGYQAVLLAWFLTRRPIIFDAFTSLYDSLVYDRKQTKKWSARALYCWLLDWLSLRAAHLVLFDTGQHIRYASETFHVQESKMRRIWIGADTAIFSPTDAPKDDTFSVLFFGTFIPLQGIEYIVGAARMLSRENVRFYVIGSGQMKNKILHLAETLRTTNVIFMDMLSQADLVKEAARADVCLGIFGNTPKTKRVIPNKVYECLAMRNPVIPADPPATRELLSAEDVFFVKTANSASLAEKILQLKNNKMAMEAIAQNGYRTIMQNATPKILGGELKRIAESLLSLRSS